MKSKTSAAAVLCVVLGVASVDEAKAAVVYRSHFVNAVGACNGALPAFEGALRKRPLAISNEGSASAFVSCSLTGDYLAYGLSFLSASFFNRGSAAATVSCTFVDGFAAPSGAPTYQTASITVAPNSGQSLRFDPAEGVFSWIGNLNCSLPPGTDIQWLYGPYAEDNGV